MLAFLVSLGLAATPCEHRHKRHAHAPCAMVPAASSKSSILERTLRRRMVLTARLAYLERKQRLLEEFLVEATTEQPIFRDDRRERFGDVDIGPTVVTRDFLGGVLVRAELRMHGGRPDEILLLTARLKAADGSAHEATVAVHLSADPASRAIELLCPQTVTPASIEWTVSRL